MVKHDILVRGVDLLGTERPSPVLLQMNTDDFPVRYLQDLATEAHPKISSVTVVEGHSPPPALFQPVQRMLHVAMVELACNSVTFPRLDPTRIESSGVVIRRVNRVNGFDDTTTLQGWMRNPGGQFQWLTLAGVDAHQDPDPAKRPQLQSGQADLDRQLAALSLSLANAESYTPAFVAPPDTCANLERTVVYALVPTASSEVSDAQPVTAPNYDPTELANNLPSLLKSGSHVAPLSGQSVDYRWMSEDFLGNQYPPGSASAGTNAAPSWQFSQFQLFATTLRLLKTAFGAFDGSQQGQNILSVLNRRIVISADGTSSTPMGDFYQDAATKLLDYFPDGSGSAAPTVTLPSDWEELSDDDQADLMNAFIGALTPKSKAVQTPVGRFQDSTRLYRLRMFSRVKGETPRCPAELVWSHYSEPFRISAWYESSDRPTPPVPLPDPTDKNFLKSVKPNCSFAVPAGLMNAMQSTSMSGLMSGSGGGSGLSLNWICGFNIPIITICAFFVLSIFLSLLNIIFFWLPIVKICIPFPAEE